MQLSKLTPFILLGSSLTLGACDSSPAKEPQTKPANIVTVTETETETETETVTETQIKLVEAPNSVTGNFVSFDSRLLGKDLYFQAYSQSEPYNMLDTTALRTRIVSLRKVGDKLVMEESVESFVGSTPGLSEKTIVAAFDIVKSEKGTLVVDFSAGMSEVFVLDGDLGYNGTGDAGRSSLSVTVTSSYVDSVTDLGNSAVEIKHNGIASLPIQSSSGDSEEQIRPTFNSNIGFSNVYKLSEVQESEEGFEPLTIIDEDDENSRVYFHTNGHNSNSYKEFSASKLDINKGMTFTLSQNTPSNMIEAVKEGVLVWNRVLGQDVLKVKTAGSNIKAPNFTHNMIQWIPEGAGAAAKADFQIDPKTGELLNANVYIGQGWADIGALATQIIEDSSEGDLMKKATRLLASHQGNVANTHLSLSGGKNSELCNRNASNLAKSVMNVAELMQTEEVDSVLISQSIIRTVIAHEIGHVLGLRHNFAGSLQSELSDAELKNVAAQIGRSEDANLDPVITSSVMDYLPLASDVILGAQLKQDDFLPSYDRMALEHLYKDDILDLSGENIACEDANTTTGFGCIRGDNGPINMDKDSYVINYIKTEMINDIKEQNIYKAYATVFGYSSFLLENAKLLSPSLTGVDRSTGELRNDLTSERLARIFGIPQLDLSELESDDKEFARDLLSFVSSFNSTVFNYLLENQTVEDAFETELAKVIASNVKGQVFAKKSSPLVATVFYGEEEREVSIPQAKFKLKEREAALNLLAPSKANYADWNLMARMELKSALILELEDVFQLKIENIDAQDQLDVVAAKYIIEQKRLIKLL